MSYLLKSATAVTFDPPSVERADLRIAAGRIVERSPRLEPLPEEEVIDLNGKLIMPGWFAHTPICIRRLREECLRPRALQQTSKISSI